MSDWDYPYKWSEDSTSLDPRDVNHSGSFSLWAPMEMETSTSQAGVTNKGQIQGKYVWVPNGSLAVDPPPTHLSVVEACSVAVWFDPGGPADKTLKNPLGGKELDLPVNAGFYKDAAVVKRYDSSSGTVELPSRDLEGTVEGVKPGGNPISYPSIGSQVGYSIWVDILNRDLFVSRANAHDEWVDANGDMNGDTTYSYVDYDAPIGIQYKRNLQSFIAHLSGSWTEHVVESTPGLTETQKGTNHNWSPSSDVASFQYNKSHIYVDQGSIIFI